MGVMDMRVIRIVRWFFEYRKKVMKRAAISILVLAGLACAMGDRPAMPPREKLDTDYVYLLGAGEPVLRVYSPQGTGRARKLEERRQAEANARALYRLHQEAALEARRKLAAAQAAPTIELILN